MNYYHVDVFSSKAMHGNGLTVVFPDRQLSSNEMLSIAREFRQFETIFVFKKNIDGAFPVRIFTVDEELEFAGHPVVGAGAVLHHLFYTLQNSAEIHLDISGRTVTLESNFFNGQYSAEMNQGTPKFMGRIDQSHYERIASAVNLKPDDLDETIPIEVVSTGLPYLLLPLKKGISQAKISINEFESFLAQFGAKFIYVFDVKTLECRTWDNYGITEDVATGSAAGPLCAYLVEHGLAQRNQIINIHQGKFTGRPSIIQGWVSQKADTEEVFIRGDVSFFASGELNHF